MNSNDQGDAFCFFVDYADALSADVVCCLPSALPGRDIDGFGLQDDFDICGADLPLSHTLLSVWRVADRLHHVYSRFLRNPPVISGLQEVERICHNRTMPKRSSKPQEQPSQAPMRDASEVAARIVEMIAQEQQGKNPYAVALGRLGGQKGGKARAAKLSAKKRTDIARHAAKARWKKEKD